MAAERAAFHMTECNQEVFSFASHFSRRVEASFTAGQVSTDGGALLLRQADRKIGLLGRVAACFIDRRSPLLVKGMRTTKYTVDGGWVGRIGYFSLLAT